MFRLVSSLAACGLAVVAHAGVLEANQHDFTASFVNPPWDYESPHVNETCLKAPGPVKKGQARMVFSALPEGTPPQPSGKWPVCVLECLLQRLKLRFVVDFQWPRCLS